MKVRALTSFCGAVTMAVGEVAEIEEGESLRNLIRIGYVKCAEAGKRGVKSSEGKRNNKRTN